MSVPFTKYVVVAAGVADGEVHEEHDNPVEGVHKYETPPAADIGVVFPMHIVAVPVAVMVGNGFTLTVTVPVPIQMPLEPTMV